MLRAVNFHAEFIPWVPMGWESRQWSLYGISSPTWSPDGTRIAYYLDFGFGEPAGIWTVGESSAPALLLPRANPLVCAWSPTGDAIAFAQQDSLWLLTVGTTSVRLLTTGIESKPSWSPDGHSIVFTSIRGGNPDLWVLDVASSAVRQLTMHEGADRNPAWSPDGRWITFSSNRGGHVDLWIIPAAGGAGIQLMDDEHWDDQPAWSPSGDRIAFVSSASRDDPDDIRWQAQIWIASHLPDVLTSSAVRSWSALKRSYR
jgi:Tol biopolymer transport system component